jgi:hypothetical protein
MLQGVSKLARESVLKLTPERLHIVANAEVGEDGALLWTEVPQAALFSDYRIESKCRNEIMLRLNCEQLLAALRSAGNSMHTTLKIAKAGDHNFVTIEASSVRRAAVTKTQGIAHLGVLSPCRLVVC